MLNTNARPLSQTQEQPQEPAPGPTCSPLQTDVLIVGAGPAGLFQVFELGLLGLHAHVIDPLPFAGGQCIELYPDKAIYDIPALPACTGQELTERLLTQIRPFEPVFHFNQLVQSIQAKTTERGFVVETQSGLCFEAQAVILANGVGAFLPRSLNAPEQADFLGKELFHGALDAALTQFHLTHPKSTTRALKVWIVGGEEEALLNALHGFEAHPNLDITLIHRREPLDVDPKLREAFEAALAKSPSAQGSIQGSVQGLTQETAHLSHKPSSLSFKHGQVVRLMGHAPSNSPLTSLQWVDAQGSMHESEVDLVLVNLGLSPQLGPIATWGAAMHKKQITVNTEDFSTAVPGLFAIGDIVTYPGKKKLILSGFHEAALASFGVAKWVLQKDRIAFEYTSASSLLQDRLGVKKEQPLKDSP